MKIRTSGPYITHAAGALKKMLDNEGFQALTICHEGRPICDHNLGCIQNVIDILCPKSPDIS